MAQPNLSPESTQDRIASMLAWMQNQTPKRTYTSVAEEMGMSTCGVSQMLRKSTISPHRHNALLKLGFPPEILPEPLFIPPGPKPQRVPTSA